MPADKLNCVDYHWFLVRTRPGHERKLCELMKSHKDKTRNILEAYCPTHTTVNVRRDGNERKLPLFDGYVFVLATQSALAGFLRENCPTAFLRYNRKQTSEEKATLCTIPEVQMQAFMNFNENYADKVVVLERPFTDYAFNPHEDNAPNESVRVIDGPLAGCEGYICRFRRKRGLVFCVQGAEPGSHLTVSYPNVYDLHVIRLHNAECDRLSMDTEKGRAADLLIGILQACGYGAQTLSVLHDLVERLIWKPSLESLCKDLRKQGRQTLADRLEQLTPGEAGLVLNLVRYEHDNPGYLRNTYPKLIIRPFLTPTSGVYIEEDKDMAELPHKDFTEVIRRTDITEEVYYPREQTDRTVATAYYAHIGIMSAPDGKGAEKSVLLFANWDSFLSEYFLTAGKANEKLVKGTVAASSHANGKAVENREKLVESFRNYAPTLYKVLTDKDSPVKAIPALKAGSDTLNVLAIRTEPESVDEATGTLIATGVRICTEINTTTHLAVWRRYLRTVWLHN